MQRRPVVPNTSLTPLIAVLAIYLPLVLWYSATVPVFEAPDESSHYRVAHHLSSVGRLPVLNYDVPGEEEHQPPLYYALVAPVLRLVQAGDGSDLMVRNPHAAISAVSSVGNKNAFLHGDPAEQWPWRDGPLAVRLSRLVSVGFGILTVTATFFIGRAVFGDRRRWLAATPAAIVAFTPQFIFISETINQDQGELPRSGNLRSTPPAEDISAVDQDFSHGCSENLTAPPTSASIKP